jgi:hypothetical protein
MGQLSPSLSIFSLATGTTGRGWRGILLSLFLSVGTTAFFLAKRYDANINCQVRLVGGIIVIALSSNPDNIGLTIGAIVLLNVGVIPLIVSTVGLIRLV